MYRNPKLKISIQRRLQIQKSNSASWCFNYFIEFLTESSFHGIGYLIHVRNRPLEVLFWLVVCILAVMGATSVVQSNWDRFQDNPTVISMDRNFFGFNTTFPSVTLCYKAGLNESKAEDYVDEYWEDADPEKREYYLEFLRSVSNYSYDKLSDLEKYVNDSTIPRDGYYEIVRRISADFPGVVEGPAKEIGLEMSERGYCYTVNSAIKDFGHDRRRNGRDNNVMARMGESYQMTYSRGVAWTMITGIDNTTDFYVHSPYETAALTDNFARAYPHYIHQMTYKTLELVATPALRTLSVKQRRCRFADESNLPISTVYSFSICQQQCRMKLAIRLCKCSPYFYPLREGFPECDINSLITCISKYGGKYGSIGM